MNKVELIRGRKYFKETENYDYYDIDENYKLYFHKDAGYIYARNTSSYGILINTSDELLKMTDVEIHKEILDEIDAFKMLKILSEE